MRVADPVALANLVVSALRSQSELGRGEAKIERASQEEDFVSEMDILIPCRPGENEELRFALRSTRNLRHRVVVTVGDRPDWCDTYHLPRRQAGEKYANTMGNIALACRNNDLTESVILSNDDIYWMQSLDEMPVLHGGPLRKELERRLWRYPGSFYTQSMLDTLNVLCRHFDVQDPMIYSIHYPLPIVRDAMVETLSAAIRHAAHLSGPRSKRLHLRTIYGNMHKIGGIEVADCKITELEQEPSFDAKFLSTVDSSFHEGKIGAFIRAQFPEPGSYERSS